MNEFLKAYFAMGLIQYLLWIILDTHIKVDPIFRNRFIYLILIPLWPYFWIKGFILLYLSLILKK